MSIQYLHSAWFLDGRTSILVSNGPFSLCIYIYTVEPQHIYLIALYIAI